MDLPTLWFALIAVLWIGYFVLEGFDYGVGSLLPVLGRDGADGAPAETRRRQMLGSIGPFWDGNEVWLLTAGGATFAAFPHWYATLFSGFYLPLLLILLALILRGVGLEYRGKVDSAVWRQRMDWMIIAGSALPALLWGVAFTNIVRGVPIDAEMEYVGGFWNLLNPVALLGGLVTLTLFLTHGGLFIALKTDGRLRHDARALALRLGVVAAGLAVVWLAVMHGSTGNALSWVLAGLAAAALVGGLVAARGGREGWGFTGTFVAIALATASLFVALFPDVMPSTLDPAWSLTIENASSSQKTLGIMTWVAVVFTPIVLLYQSWTYWTFRKRISGHHIPTDVHHAAATAETRDRTTA
ncbi:cytochrome d ubiquinol oxidase subunit II [Ornithinimicrobium humiphilum]|uniref:Cytochrome bd-I ubiquinol oxidase subunit 2 apoprotein n=1 Tax=Ornithinimicrobium humiphilum TaxID=125288 RepID=A0A543KK23_9MICO|nr:cytochrome d ubiquinol oxidase subunit II [Ornithinimicrobium humiphilum]TQM95396.1 cytochrome bd-I ubiquinol oxidase subunit 2 apoprotein [Ornithinimicrobium humiphilum]